MSVNSQFNKLHTPCSKRDVSTSWSIAEFSSIFDTNGAMRSCAYFLTVEEQNTCKEFKGISVSSCQHQQIMCPADVQLTCFPHHALLLRKGLKGRKGDNPLVCGCFCGRMGRPAPPSSLTCTPWSTDLSARLKPGQTTVF